MRECIRKAVFCVMLAGVGASATGSARADTWVTNADTCGTFLPNVAGGVPQFFAYTNGPSGVRLYSAYSINQGWTLQNIVPTGPLRTTQLGCAAQGTQELIIYRDSASNLRSRDRLSNWSESVVPVVTGFTADGQGTFVTPVNDNGQPKFVAFYTAGANFIDMNVWNDAANPKWGTPILLDQVPGGLSTNSEHRLTGYAIAVGPSATQASVSLFVVSSDGHLRENKGILGSTRTWIDHGLAPGNKTFSPGSGFGPTATGLYGAVFGHPGDFSESEYNRRIVLPTADQSAIFMRVAGVGANAFTWQQIAGSGTSAPLTFNLAGGRATGCFNFGEPCANAMEIASRVSPDGGQSFRIQSFYSGVTDNGTPGPTWTTQPTAFSNGAAQPAYSYAPWATRGISVYIDSGNNLATVNLDTGVVTNLGHP
jgi:hypothetical protein